MRVGAVLAKWRDGDDDQCRIERRECVIPKAQTFHVAWGKGLDEEVGRGHQPLQQGAPVTAGEIERDTTFVGGVRPPKQTPVGVGLVLIEGAKAPC